MNVEMFETLGNTGESEFLSANVLLCIEACCDACSCDACSCEGCCSCCA